MIGDVIGTGVFLESAGDDVQRRIAGMVVAVWVVGGLLSLAGALTYAELAAMMPRAGGEYVFIRNAYGRLPGFLYGWTRFFVASTGGIAGLAAGFAIFLNIVARRSHRRAVADPPIGGRQMVFTGLHGVAVAAIVVVTLVNCAAIAVSGRIAMVLTALKIALVTAAVRRGVPVRSSCVGR